MTDETYNCSVETLNEFKIHFIINFTRYLLLELLIIVAPQFYVVFCEFMATLTYNKKHFNVIYADMTDIVLAKYWTQKNTS